VYDCVFTSVLYSLVVDHFRDAQDRSSAAVAAAASERHPSSMQLQMQPQININEKPSRTGSRYLNLFVARFSNGRKAKLPTKTSRCGYNVLPHALHPNFLTRTLLSMTACCGPVGLNDVSSCRRVLLWANISSLTVDHSKVLLHQVCVESASSLVVHSTLLDEAPSCCSYQELQQSR